jgi:predicted ester cyclase
MSAQTNKAIVRRYIQELNQRNLAVLDELVAVDFRSTVLEGYSHNITAFPDYHVTIEDMIAEDDKVVLVWNHQGTHRGVYEGVSPTGKVIIGRHISIYNIVDGLISGADGVWDAASIWQQLGLIPDTEEILAKRNP